MKQFNNKYYVIYIIIKISDVSVLLLKLIDSICALNSRIILLFSCSEN